MAQEHLKNEPKPSTEFTATRRNTRGSQSEIQRLIEQCGDFSIETTAYLDQWQEHTTDGVLRISYKETFASRGETTLHSILKAAREASKLHVPTFVDITALDPNDHYGFFARTGLLRFDSHTLEDLARCESGSSEHRPKEQTRYSLPLGARFLGPQPDDMIEHCDRLSENQEAFLLELIRVDSQLNRLAGVVCNTRFARQTSPLLRVSNGPILEGRYALKKGSGVTSSLKLWPGTERFRECSKELAWCTQSEVASAEAFSEFKSDIDHSWLERRKTLIRVMFSPEPEYQRKRDLIDEAIQQALALAGNNSDELRRAATDCPWWMPS